MLAPKDITNNGSVLILVSDCQQQSQLQDGFQPGPNDVVCARGKSFWDHKGNQKYRMLIAKSTNKYASTTNKLAKTLIVSEIIEAVHMSGGKFVKKEKASTGQGESWAEVHEILAREKVSQSLRDGLSSKYRSSTKAKKERRNQVDIAQVIQSNSLIAKRIDNLIIESQRCDSADDISIESGLSQVNISILESIKLDASMLHRYMELTCF
jgi:hypothetical protein